MTFEIYTRTAGQKLGTNYEPVVSLRKSGALAFSGGAQRLLGIVDRQEIVLLFDPATGQIGIRTAYTSDVSTAKLTVTKNSETAPNAALMVSAVGFFKHFRIDGTLAHGMYPLCADDRSKLAIVQLLAGSWHRAVDVTTIRERLHGKRGVA